MTMRDNGKTERRRPLLPGHSMEINFTPIGYFKTPFTKLDNMPIQPAGAKNIEGIIEILPEFQEGLTDLDGFSHIIVLNYLHQSKGYKLMVMPFLDDKLHGVFATRSPKRPNSIGLSVMELVRVENGKVYVRGVDVLNGTPVLDIKPYVADFDKFEATRFGWTEGKSTTVSTHRSDDRFLDD